VFTIVVPMLAIVRVWLFFLISNQVAEKTCDREISRREKRADTEKSREAGD
jgi:hypothetical protein